MGFLWHVSTCLVYPHALQILGQDAVTLLAKILISLYRLDPFKGHS
jgi:hypothetical protein